MLSTPPEGHGFSEHREMKKYAIIEFAVILLSIVAGLLLFYSTAKKPVRPAPEPPPLKRVRIGYIPIADCAQLYVAIEQGFFAEERLNVELVPMAGGAKILEALTSGSVEIAFSNVISLLLARSAGLLFVAITGGPVEDNEHREHAILVRKDSGFTKPTDLEGKTMALNTRKNIDEMFVRRYLSHHGVAVDKVEFIEVPFPRMEPVLLAGEVEAVAAIEPFVTFALQHGEVDVLGYNYVELEDRIQISSYDVREDWLAGNLETGRGFCNALTKATDYILTHDQETRAVVSKHTKLDDAQVQQITLPTFSKSLPREELQRRIRELVDLGWIPETFDAETVVHQW